MGKGGKSGTGFLKYSDTGKGISWHLRCVAILSSFCYNGIGRFLAVGNNIIFITCAF